MFSAVAANVGTKRLNKIHEENQAKELAVFQEQLNQEKEALFKEVEATIAANNAARKNSVTDSMFKAKYTTVYIEHKWLDIYKADAVGKISAEMFLKAIKMDFQITNDVYDILKHKKEAIFNFIKSKINEEIATKGRADEFYHLLSHARAKTNPGHPIFILFHTPSRFPYLPPTSRSGLLKEINEYLDSLQNVEMKERNSTQIMLGK